MNPTVDKHADLLNGADMPNIEKYIALMHDVKARIALIDTVGNLQPAHGLPLGNIEMVYLQFRKMLEQIAFGSLVANEPAFSSAYDKCAHRYWRPETLLKDLEAVNPGFYPDSIIDVLDPRPGVRADWQKNPDALTKDEFAQLYNMCGTILHTSNPYGTPIDYAYYKASIPSWRSKIIALLNKHCVRLVDDRYLYLIQMGGPNGSISYNIFARVEAVEIPTSLN